MSLVANALLIAWPGDAPDQIVLGFRVRTWGRVGKVAQYVGGLTALIDILGPDRILVARDMLLRMKPGTGDSLADFGAAALHYLFALVWYPLLVSAVLWLTSFLPGRWVGPAVGTALLVGPSLWVVAQTFFVVVSGLLLLTAMVFGVVATITRTTRVLRISGILVLSSGFVLDLLAS